MVVTYLFCLVAGGILIALSLSGDNSSDGFEGDGEGGSFTLLFSTSFWSFGMAGFGLCGLLISLFNGDGTSLGSMLVAAGTGVGLGLAAAKTLIRSDDLAGQRAVVTLRVEPDQRGFVEVNVRGSLIRRPAVSTGQSLAKGTPVVILNAEDHTLEVEQV